MLLHGLLPRSSTSLIATPLLEPRTRESATKLSSQLLCGIHVVKPRLPTCRAQSTDSLEQPSDTQPTNDVGERKDGQVSGWKRRGEGGRSPKLTRRSKRTPAAMTRSKAAKLRAAAAAAANEAANVKVSRKIEPFSASGPVESERGASDTEQSAYNATSFKSWTPVDTGLTEYAMSPSERTSKDSPDALCDGTFEAVLSSDDGILLETADLIPADSMSDRIQSIDDLSGMRGVVQAWEGEGQFNSWNVAHCLQSMGQLGRTLSPHQLDAIQQDPLTADLVTLLERRISQFNPLALVVSLWGMASMQYNPGSAMTVMIRALEAQIDEYGPRQLATILWSFGKLQIHPGNSLMDALTARTALVLVDMEPQGLSNLAWAYARLLEAPDGLLDAIAQEAAPKIASFSPQGLSNLAWAYAKLHHTPPADLLDQLEDQSIIRFPELSSQSIANMLWALTTFKRRPIKLLDIVTREVKQCGLQFQPMDCMHMMVSFALISDRRYTPVVDLVMKQCTSDLDSYMPDHLTGILWAVSELRHPGGAAFAHQLLPRITPFVSTISPQNTANLLFALGKIGVRVPYHTAGILTSHINAQSRHMDCKQLSCAAQGACKAPGFKQWQRKQIMRVLAQSMLPQIKLGMATSQEIVCTLDSMLKLGSFPITFALPAFEQLRNLMYRGEVSAIDIAMIAQVIGKWRGGQSGDNNKRNPVVIDLFNMVQEAAVPYLADHSFSPRQLANVIWAHGRMNIRPYNMEFMHLSSEMIVDRIDTFNPLDVANIMTGLTAMDQSPGLIALDAMAEHLNNRYREYGPVEVAQTVYGFSRLNFHPGAVVGRVHVVYRAQPELFTRQGRWLLDYALKMLEGQDSKSRVFGSMEFDPLSEEQVQDVVTRASQKGRGKNDIWAKVKSGYSQPDSSSKGLSSQDEFDYFNESQPAWNATYDAKDFDGVF